MSEFFADFGNYDVTLTVPDTHVVAATGMLVKARDNADATRTLTYRAEAVHDFAWMADPFMQTISGLARTSTGDVEVRVYFRPEQAEFAERHLAAGIGAIEQFSKMFVPYPWTRMSIIDPPPGADGAGGMEYPTLVTTGGDSVFMPEGFYLPEFVTIHEVGHNWFQGLLASNEVDEAWLDEGMNQYADGLVMNALYGEEAGLIDWGGLYASYYAFGQAITRGPGEVPDPIAQRSYQFVDFAAYGTATYYKTASAMRTLEKTVGSERFLAALRAYAEKHAFTHPSEADLVAALESKLGEDLDWLLGPAMHQAGASADLRVRKHLVPHKARAAGRVRARLRPQGGRHRAGRGRAADVRGGGREHRRGGRPGRCRDHVRRRREAAQALGRPRPRAEMGPLRAGEPGADRRGGDRPGRPGAARPQRRAPRPARHPQHRRAGARRQPRPVLDPDRHAAARPMTVENTFFGSEDLRPPTERAERDERDDRDPDPNESIGSASRSMMGRPTLRLLLRAGAGSLRRFPGMVLVLYAIQLALSAGTALLFAVLLYGAFGDRPLFDRAMDGDLSALVTCVLAEPELLRTLMWIGLVSVIGYSVVSWFLTAGLIAVLLDAPSRRREVVRWFGSAGAANFFPFLRLSLWSALPQVAVLVVAAVGVGFVRYRLEHAFDTRGVLEALAIGLSPALLLHWIVATAIDYARIDLVRHPGMSSVRGLMRGFGAVTRNRLTLVHTLLYGLVFGGASALYGWMTVSGALAGLIALILVRQLVSLVRFAAHVALIAGQVELACAVMLTPLGRRR